MNYDNLIRDSKELLNGELNYNATNDGLAVVFNQWERKKKPLIELFRKHPNWNEEKLRIEIDTDFYRGVDNTVVGKFTRWCQNEIAKIYKEKYKVRHGCFSYTEIRNVADELWGQIDILENDCICDIPTIEKMLKEKRKLRSHYLELLEKMREKVEGIEYIDGEALPTEKASEVNMIWEVLYYIQSHPSQFIEDENVEILNEKLKNANIDLEAKVGQKMSRFVGALCKKIGLNEITQIIMKEWVSDDGSHHEREVDEGYNKQYAAFCDAVNPLKVSEKLFISVNPLDYWTMSFGNGWSSCYCIDKENKRNLSSSYNGDYCAGTTSYMLDESSFIVYTEADENEWGSYAKKRRCVFAWGSNKLFQSRVYPDGRDGGDKSYATQLREVMQKLFADLLDKPNLWIKKCNFDDLYSWEGLGYNDFLNACETNVSCLKLDENGTIDSTVVQISDTPICISTGEHYHYNEVIDTTWEDDHYSCERCDERVSESNAIFIDGHAYCSDWCAEQDGWVYCPNVSDYYWNENPDVYYIDGEYYCDTYGEVITTADGSVFRNVYDASNNEYEYCEDTDDYRNDWVYDEYDGCYYHDNSNMVTTVDGYQYRNSDNAEADGWRYCELDCEWYKEEDVIYDDYHKIYVNKENDLITIKYKDNNKECTTFFLSINAAISDGFISSESDVVLEDADNKVYSRIEIESEVA